MSTLQLLIKLESFLAQDLKNEKLSAKNLTKKTKLLEKLKQVIHSENENEKLDEFLNNQRNMTKQVNGVTQSNGKCKNLPLPELPTNTNVNNDYESAYIDLNEPFCSPATSTPGAYKQQVSVPASSVGDASGSGYESYESEDETRSKPQKELEAYYGTDDCDVYSFVFMENKTFLGGRKWYKRVGIVKDCHLKCFKKLGDSLSVLDLPLRNLTAYLSTKEGTNDIIINLEAAGSQGSKEAQGCLSRFYVAHSDADSWSRVLREKCHSIVTAGSLPPPPVSSRPNPDRPMTRTASLGGMTSENHSNGIKAVNHNSDISPTNSSNSLNNIGKGLKSAAAELFKGNKLKKKITVIEQLGADLVGSLGVYHEGRWAKKLCVIKGNELGVYGKEEEAEQVIALHGCDLKPYFDDPDRKFAFKITKDKKELLFLEASSSQEMGRWIGVLVAETGLGDIPEHKQEEEDLYVEPSEYQSIIDSARQAYHETIKLKKSGGRSGTQQPIIEEEESTYLDIAETMPKKSPVRSHAKSQPFITPLLVETTSKPRAFSEPVNTLPTVPTRPKRKPKNKKEPIKIEVPMTSRNTSSSSSSGISSAEPSTPSSFLFNQTNAKTDIKTKKKEMKSEFFVVKSPKKTDRTMTQESNDENLESRLAEITHNITQMNIKKQQLSNYLDEAKTSLEKSSVNKALKKTNEELKKLESEKKVAEMKINKKQEALDNEGNKRPMTSQSRPRSITDSTASKELPKGNVMSRAKMFENL